MKRLSIMLFSIILLFTACGQLEKTNGEKADVEDQIIAVDSVIAGNEELTVESTFVGTIAPEDRVSIFPTAIGTVKRVLVKEGEKVKVGQILFTIDDDMAQLSLKSAESGYEQAKKSRDQMFGAKTELEDYNYDRTISGFVDSISGLESSKSELSTAISDLDDYIDYLDLQIAALNGADVKYIKASGYKMEYEMLQFSDATLIGLSITEAVALSKPNAITINGKMLADGISADDITAYGISLLEADANELNDLQITKSKTQASRTSMVAQKDTIDGSISDLNSQKDATEDIKVITDKMSDEARAVVNQQIKSAEIGIESAQTQLDGYVITSPINGTVETVNVTENGMISQATYSVMVADKSHMVVRFYVSQKIRDNLVMNDEIEIDLGSEERIGKITQIAVAKSQQKGLYQIEASIIGNTDNLLSDVSVNVNVATLRDDSGIVIPYDSVYFSGDKAYVYAVESGVAIKKYVETGTFNDMDIVITCGLDSGDVVITSWAPNLENGSLVSVN